jgi:hypothetical protein
VAVVAAHTGAEVIDPNVWSPRDDTKLMELFRAGTPLDQTADILGRSSQDIWTRLSQIV